MAVPTTEAEIAAVFANKAEFSLGCMFAQIVVDTFFAGILTMQTIMYVKYQKKDSRWTRAVVIFAILLNAGVTVYLWLAILRAKLDPQVFIQYLFVENFGLWAPFAQTKWLAPFPFLDALNSGAIQAFFTYRAWRLCGRKIIIPFVCGILILMSLGAALSIWVIFSRFESLFMAAGVSVPEYIWLASIMTADIIITVCILTGLIRSKTGWSHTDKTISRLIRMTLESQVPPTFIAITFMVEFSLEPSSLFGSTLQGIQPKLYAMGLMYALNQRVNFHARYSVNEDPIDGQVFALSDRPTQKTIQVEVETDTHVQHETIVSRPPGINRVRHACYIRAEADPRAYEFEDDKVRDIESESDGPSERSLGYSSQAQLTQLPRSG